MGKCARSDGVMLELPRKQQRTIEPLDGPHHVDLNLPILRPCQLRRFYKAVGMLRKI